MAVVCKKAAGIVHEGCCRGALICCYSALFVPLSIAFALQNENLGVIDKTVGDRGGHSGAVKDIPPLRKRQICS